MRNREIAWILWGGHFCPLAFVALTAKNTPTALAEREKTPAPKRNQPTPAGYFTSTVAPASANFFLMVSASSLETPSFTFLGAPSTSSLASFKPRLVTSRTALITLILLAPTSFRTTVNSVFSSAGAAAAAPPPPAIMTGAAAAADTPRRSSSFFTSCAASSSDNPTIDSSNCCRSAILFLHLVSVLLFRYPQARVPVRPGPFPSRQTTQSDEPRNP